MIYTAIDVGASSGRIMVGELNEGKLDIQEIQGSLTVSVKETGIAFGILIIC